MLRIDIQNIQQQVTLHCSGRIVLGVESETLLCMVTSRQEGCLRLDLREVQKIDASGLGTLLELRCWANDNHKILRIENPSRPVRRVLALTNLVSVFDISYAAERAAGSEEPVGALLCARSALSA